MEILINISNTNSKKKRLILVAIFFLCTNTFLAQNRHSNRKIKKLSKLIKAAEINKIDASKEKMAIRTAEIFLKYANWDKNNKESNEALFKKVARYKDDAKTWAKKLPDFEIAEVNKLLDSSIYTLQLEIKGEINRKPTQHIDWSKLKIIGNKIINKENNRPVFLADWIWKPNTDELTEYFGNFDGFFFTHKYLTNDNGGLKPFIEKKLAQKEEGNIGDIFLNHKGIPSWALVKDPDLKIGARRYTSYDIDNPIARKMNEGLLQTAIPYMKGKKFATMYMLTNEPHWHTREGAWDTGQVSVHTMNKFKKWLQEKHKSINILNEIWGTFYSSFSDVDLEIPIALSFKGKPQWYDWIRFNQNRVTEWFDFLHTTVKKFDPNALTHIKNIPHFWSKNDRNHGIDFEAHSQMTDILGNDAASYYMQMWGKDTTGWTERYSFNWFELGLSYDFLKSVGPNKINFNSEGHFLSTGRFRDLEMKPSYARASHWLATISGLNAMKNWVWYRNEDGSFDFKRETKGFAGSNMQQPRIIYEVTSTFMDLNAHSEEITQLQNTERPLRIFQSETSAINTEDYMDNIRKIYEDLYFEGVALGFATENILSNQNSTNWKAIYITDTNFVTDSEFESLQAYLNNKGTIIMDSKCLLKNEYGITRKEILKANNGTLLVFDDKKEAFNTAINFLHTNRPISQINIGETNATSKKGCYWRIYQKTKNKYVATIINLGKSKAKVTLTSDDENIKILKNLLNGKTYDTNSFYMSPNDVVLLKIDTTKKM